MYIDIEHEYINKLAKDLADSIDNEVLYNAMGWTIVNIPHPWFIPHLLNNKVTAWLKENNIECHYWDSKIAFKEGRDATFFLLKWL